ncbi:helix-turn-helix transcriptional regulator [Halorientalis pallida]|uniref:helix-turn-helix transcriptional regulator n=1 Tax=Halorientalis pallida TaxID=2479928 RepID=UPI003C7016F3
MLTRAHAALLASLALLLTAGPVAAPALADGAEAHQPAVSSGVSLQTQDTELNRTDTTFTVGIRSNGDAVWTIRRNYTVDTEAKRAAFSSVARDFESGSGLDTIRTARAASERASAATGRPMEITGVTRRSTITGDTGELVLEFTWTGFARKSGTYLYVDDVFLSPNGTWFPTLGANQTLTIVPPRAYDLYSASPPGYSVTNASLRWEGDQEGTFEVSQPSVVYQRSGNATSPNASTPGPQSGGISPLLLVGIAALFVAVVIAYLLATRDFDVPSPAAPTDTGDGGSDGDDPPAAAGTAASTTDGGTAAGAAEAGDDEIDEELLSDEERIERLLERNGGRMKQANIVKETDWSNAKVSQLLSSMDDEGRIDKLRIGRENLISFPDEDITDTNGEEPENGG